jgi:hypothetical protein
MFYKYKNIPLEKGGFVNKGERRTKEKQKQKKKNKKEFSAGARFYKVLIYKVLLI